MSSRRSPTYNIFGTRYNSACGGLTIYKYHLKSDNWIEFRTIETEGGKNEWAYANGILIEFEISYYKRNCQVSGINTFIEVLWNRSNDSIYV